MDIISRVLRPDAYSIAVEFTEEALSLGEHHEITMWCTGIQLQETYSMLPLTSNSMTKIPVWSRYAELNTIPNIKSSLYFNSYPDFPNCLIISFNGEVESGYLHLTSRNRLEGSSFVPEQLFPF